MSTSQNHDNWTVTWKLHFHTSQLKKVARIFATITKRTGVNLQLASSGLREARPGSWARAKVELSGPLGDAVITVLDDARKFGEHVAITGPVRSGEAEVSFSGWIDRCSHCELAAVEFEMTNCAAMSVRIPNSEQLELLEALEFHAGIRMRRPAMFDPHIEPAHAQFRSPGCQRNWASIANASEIARRFAASGGETSEVTVPFVLAVWTLAGVTRTFALDPGTTPQQDRPESSDDDIGRLRDFVAELDRAVTDILSSHAESRRWSSRQEPGDFGRCADFETLLEWWYGGHVTQLGFLAHLSRLLTDHDIDGIMERIPPRLYSVVLAWASEICDALNQGEELWDFISGEPADPARIPVLCRWLARKASVEGH